MPLCMSVNTLIQYTLYTSVFVYLHVCIEGKITSQYLFNVLPLRV